jgi:4-hydroxy-tetrahydrodipicolinate reductase
MKIALIGYGKMGQMIESIAPTHHIEVVAHFDEFNLLTDSEEHRILLKDVNILVDFSTPSSVVDNIRIGAKLAKNMVVGTTGWYDQMDEVKSLVKETDIGFIYGSNYSLGVNLMFKIVRYASGLFAAFDGYDSYIEENHHKMKKDIPSGTAIVIKKIMEEKYLNKEIPVNSIRAGYTPGTHSINFDSVVDSVRIEHIARNRQGFVEGSFLAVKWINNKKGFFEFNDVLDDIICDK